VRVTQDVVLTIGRCRHRFVGIEHERCRRCGERIFGLDASREFDAALRRRRSRAA